MKAARLALFLNLALVGCTEPQSTEIDLLRSQVGKLEGQLAAIQQNIETEKSARAAELQDKLDQLERRLKDANAEIAGPLARRIGQLERDQPRPVAARGKRRDGPVGEADQEAINLWRSLKTGMSKTDIRELLGDPHSKDAREAWEDWYFSDRGALGPFVRFNVDGELIGWNEPRLAEAS